MKFIPQIEQLESRDSASVIVLPIVRFPPPTLSLDPKDPKAIFQPPPEHEGLHKGRK